MHPRTSNQVAHCTDSVTCCFELACTPSVELERYFGDADVFPVLR
jgi:hypothetical protein